MVCKKAAGPPLIYLKPDDRRQLIPPLTQTLQGQGQAISLAGEHFGTVAQKPFRFASWTHVQILALAGFSKRSSANSKAFLESSNTYTHVQTFHVRLFMDRGKSKVDSNHLQN